MKRVEKYVAIILSAAMIMTGTSVSAAEMDTLPEEIGQTKMEDAVAKDFALVSDNSAVDVEMAVDKTVSGSEISALDGELKLNSEAGPDSSYNLSNPHKDSNGNTVWDYVYFGSYPQAEIISDNSTYTAIRSEYLNDGDLIEDSDLYSALQSADFDIKGFTNVTYEGETWICKRVGPNDAKFTMSPGSNCYHWPGGPTYHYFRCQPIKWRVLSVSGNDALLLADKALDHEQYNGSSLTRTWENSTIRKWLNDSFFNTAFTSEQQDAINTVTVTIDDNPDYGTSGGNDTNDKVFLLSISESYSSDYGFGRRYYENVAARKSQSSTYAKAMGVQWATTNGYNGCCNWWLRSPGSDSEHAAYVGTDGDVYRYGNTVSLVSYAVRPALHLNLSSGLWNSTRTAHSDSVTSDVVSVSFNATGGTCSETEMAVKYGTEYGNLPTPTREGYRFGGWFTEEYGGTQVSNSTVVQSNEPHTLYAHWGQLVSVSLNAVGGICSKSEVSVPYSMEYGDLPTPTREGYHFGGWFTEEYGGVQVSSSTVVQSNEPHTLYAHWGQLVSVSLNAVGGICSKSEISVPYGMEYGTLPTPTREGYGFLGWFTEKISGTQILSTSVVPVKDSHTLYAHWEKNFEGLEKPIKENGNTVWNCIYFGSYPQAEVIANKGTYKAIDSTWLNSYDLIEDPALYKKLQDTSFNSAGFASLTYEGATWTYKRIRRSNATCYGITGSSYYYKWLDSTTYHYFRCQPIKWRVLSVSGNDALLLADKGLDIQSYNTSDTTITWENSTIRSWLNGRFLSTAFTSEQQDAINTVTVTNSRNPDSEISGGNNTDDKVFLLSCAEICDSDYGFSSSFEDESRGAGSSTYAKAMGSYLDPSSVRSKNCDWWLRSPGGYFDYAANVSDTCYVANVGSNVTCHEGIRPALHLNLSSNLWEACGTVCSDGTVSGDGISHEVDDDETVVTSISLNLATGQKYTDSSWAKAKADGKHYTIVEAKVDKKIAECSSKGVISAKKTGTAYIEVNKPGYLYKITVNVVSPHFIYPGAKAKTFTVNAGDKFTPEFDACGLDATFSIPVKQQKYATVDSKTGEVTAIAKGNITVYATVGGTDGYSTHSTTAKISIYNPLISSRNTVKKGKTLTMKITGGVKTTVWSVENGTGSATISSKGKLKALSEGTVTVTAVNNSRELSKEITITP